jgi:zinc transport system ATP-binding protein
MPMTTPIIKVSHLQFSYNSSPVLRDLSFEIYKGEYVGLIGPNGSGKTTLLRLILGLNTKQKGSIQIFGQEIEKFRDFAKIGYIPQKVGVIGLDFPATVREVVASNFHNNPRESLEKAINRVAQLTEITDFMDKLLADLSGGQLQRVFIARSLINNPEILIFDEPTVGVDKENQINFYRFLKKANEELGITILFVTHDIETISEQATKILCINEGVFEEVDSHLHGHDHHKLHDTQYAQSSLSDKIQHIH